MAELINLRQARKARGRAESERKAVENRAAHGRSKAEKTVAKAEAERERAKLDGAKREPEP
jgi:hypothetical protein